MGSIVTIATSKGGGGKSTLAQFLAANMAVHGYKITVIDADANESFREWHTNIYEGAAFQCIAECRQAELVDIAQAEAERVDIVLIDTAGFMNLAAAYAISAADFVLIPCMPDRGSARETIRTARQVETLSKAARRKVPYRIVGTRWREGGRMEGATMAELAAENLPMMARRVPMLAAFGDASYTGKMPTKGRLGLDADALISEMVTLGAISAAPEKEYA